MLGISPTVDVIRERSDSFELNVEHHIKETEVGAGLRYETGRMDDGLNITQFPGEPVQQEITDRQGTTYDLFGFHTFTETWLKKNLMLSVRFLLLGPRQPCFWKPHLRNRLWRRLYAEPALWLRLL